MSDPKNTATPIDVSVHGEQRRRPTRRETMQWVLAAVAANSLPGADALAQESPQKAPAQEHAADTAKNAAPQGYGVDADLKKNYKPGDVWPLTFNDAQKKCATALADTIIPEDKLGPAASDVGVVEMVDEWVSAPYPAQAEDRPIIIEGLAWLDAECTTRFKKTFADCADEQKNAVCDDICFTATAKPEFKRAATFFSRFRSLCAGAYYATPEGWKSIGYVGNVQLAAFTGPPPAVLAKLGL